MEKSRTFLRNSTRTMGDFGNVLTRWVICTAEGPRLLLSIVWTSQKEISSFSEIRELGITGVIARETSGPGTSAPQTWKETFGYDHYGNRTSHAKFDGTTQLASSNITDPTIDPATNRFQTGQGYSFDKNGNLISDADARSFTLVPITSNLTSYRTEILSPSISLTARGNA
jgi:YD repeat-containing protein